MSTAPKLAGEVDGAVREGELPPVVLMVSGGSDSTALAYAAAELRDAGVFGCVAVLHVNHRLRGRDADDDASFVEQLANLLDMRFFLREADVAAEAARTGENVEASARRIRYAVAAEVLGELCKMQGDAGGCIFTAHTADDRAENFYMRSIVGTGPGGFRSMRYRTGAVARPLLDESRETLRAYVEARAAAGLPVVRDAAGALWREDATNAHTDRFRAYVRHEMVPRAKAWSPGALDALVRSMNLIADEDDLLEDMAAEIEREHVQPLGGGGRPFCVRRGSGTPSPASEGFLLLPSFGRVARALQRRVVRRGLKGMLGQDKRIDAAAVEAVLGGFADGTPKSGYVTNIQGNIAVSANKAGVRVEPMAAFRARRKRS